ncbi:MAG TPA: sulfite exporter TauE/SafE family protein [Vicinamibacterales bacterium]|nr:sulfite exporter TauE/SafE family protein [Vicinamibacterales bacterium]
MSATTVEVGAILFAATFVRSAFGFGEALVAVPLLALVMPITVATPVAALVSITVAAVVVVQDWQHVQWKSAAGLVLSTLVGIPFGLLLLTRTPEPVVKTILGVVIAVFALQALRGIAWHLASDATAWLFGLAAGVLGGAYGMNGPPLAVYGLMRRWSPQKFRATLQGYFLPASTIGMAGYWFVGLWTQTVNHLYVESLPLVIAAIFLGRVANRRMTDRRFHAVVYVGLLIVGVILVLQAATLKPLTIL